MFLKYLVLVCMTCTSITYDLKCPDAPQRSTRANVLCLNPSKYSCIHDLINKRFLENCTIIDLEQPGKRIVLSGGIDSVKCSKNRYHPRLIPYWTNTSTDCIYKRSQCGEIGQIEVSNNDVNKDTTCRCDYTKGYDYVTRPENICSCIPSREDCSCYRHYCPANNLIISPDYKCVKVVYGGKFNCPFISTVRNNQNTSTVTTKITTTLQVPLIKVLRSNFPVFVMIVIALLAKRSSTSFKRSRTEFTDN